VREFLTGESKFSKGGSYEPPDIDISRTAGFKNVSSDERSQ
jgi:hypothetical protein